MTDEETGQPHGGLSESEHRIVQAVMRREHAVRNPNELLTAHMSFGERVADGVTRQLGSWRFIIIQSVLLVCWLVLNTVAWINNWDPYPFILLNLALSFQAAYSAPIIMMSQNRQAAKDRLTTEQDYLVNVRAEVEIAELHRRLDVLTGTQWDILLEMQREQLRLLQRIDELQQQLAAQR